MLPKPIISCLAMTITTSCYISPLLSITMSGFMQSWQVIKTLSKIYLKNV
ncbi:hypothetical protein rv5_gp023 [Escherichia phage V5]|uniref:Uncharacterized protein n=2 Tax=Vequintavirus TaxID=1914852 RepID=B3RGG2_9CAUD|nr:hypothetical protein rv5_gp023 [Escherichia phage V5]YP_008530267.1 hypothetical protein P766_gp022 [Escherichia phage JES2013]ABI79094.1 hypothetical protein [Escherichia phage V5]AGM12411.1 hypothetical protein Ec2_0022 [Escherichia phage JES2013]